MKGHLSQSLLELSKQKSLVPFLYQTRTLLVLPACARQVPSVRHGQQQRLFSTHPSSCSPQRTSWPAKKATASPQSTATTSGKKTNKKKTGSASGAGDGTQPTGLKSYLMRRAIARTRKEKSGLKAAMTDPGVTHDEKQAFLKLLSGLETRASGTAAAAAAAAAGTGTSTTSSDRSPGGETGEMSGDKALSHISDIFKNLLKERREKRRGKNAWDSNEDAMAESSAHAHAHADAQTQAPALGQSNGADFRVEEIAELVQKGLMPVEQAIDWIVQRELRDVQAALESAAGQDEGDALMWEICKQRIFSLVKYFDTAEVANEGSEKSSSATERNAPATCSSDRPSPTDDQPDTHRLPLSPSTSSSPLKIPPPVPEAAVVTTLYPQLLVIAFRVLKRTFPSSPLVSQFHTAIKSHGRTSTVLAASTELYNELISAEWEIYKNIPGVFSLLKEMETLGVDPDWDTFHFMQAIGRRRNIDRKKYLSSAKHGGNGRGGGGGGRGGGSTPYGLWWDLPPNKEAMKLLLGPEGWLARFKRSRREMAERRKVEVQMLRSEGLEVDDDEVKAGEEREKDVDDVEDEGGDEDDVRYRVERQ